MKEGRPKRLPAVRFYLYDILEKVKQERQEKVKQERQEMDQRLPGAGVRAWEKSWGCGNTLDYIVTACVY